MKDSEACDLVPLEFMPHEEPRVRALQAAGLEFEHDDPAARDSSSSVLHLETTLRMTCL